MFKLPFSSVIIDGFTTAFTIKKNGSKKRDAITEVNGKLPFTVGNPTTEHLLKVCLEMFYMFLHLPNPTQWLVGYANIAQNRLLTVKGQKSL